jgi:hypothetical protein
MKYFAVTNQSVITNVIIADSLEIAEELTGEVCFEFTSENPVGIGWRLVDGIWTEPVILEDNN